MRAGNPANREITRRTFLTGILGAGVVGILPKAAKGYAAAQHNQYLDEVLFENGSYSLKHASKVEALEAACYLCLDQYNGQGQSSLDLLRDEKGVGGLPKSIGKFNFTLEGASGTHRQFTHKGWNHSYIDTRAKWDLRKDILRKTVDHLFNFGFKNEHLTWGFCRQCDSFSALVYYTHVLGDYIDNLSKLLDGGKTDITKEMISFAEVSHWENPDIFSEIGSHAAILFGTQKDTNVYGSFACSLNELSAKARNVAGGIGGTLTEEEVSVLFDLAGNIPGQNQHGLMKALIDHIPKMLWREDFFKREFI